MMTNQWKNVALVASLLAVASTSVSAFSVMGTSSVNNNVKIEKIVEGPEKTISSRRSLLVSGAAALVAAAVTSTAASPAHAALGAGTPVGREIDTFNSLIYNFKNVDLGGGLDASTLNEPSIPFIEFGEKMKNGEVAFVEFMAPSGDVAYVTLKPGKGEKKSSNKGPIRIGQGYPINKKGSWSSPDYVIRAVSNFGVPYKFTVPALAKYNKK